MKSIMFTLVIFAPLSALPVFAADDHAGHGDSHRVTPSALTVHTGHGKVISTDAKGGTVKIAHDPIQSINWKRMTMDFKVIDVSMLEGIKPGMSVQFELLKVGNEYQIKTISPSN